MHSRPRCTGRRRVRCSWTIRLATAAAFGLVLVAGADPALARKLPVQKPERIVRAVPSADRPGLARGAAGADAVPVRPHHLQIGGAPPPVFQRSDVERRPSVLMRGVGADTLYIRVAVLRVEFETDRAGSRTTGDGRFLRENPDPEGIFIDPAPHDADYFAKHIEAVDRYWQSMTWGAVRIVGEVFPRGQEFGSYLLSDMEDYGPTDPDEFFSIEGLTNYSRESLIAADADPDLVWGDYDVYFVVHAGADWQNDIFQDTPLDLPTFSIVFSDSDLVVSDEGDTLETMITYPESASQDGFLVALNGGIAHEMGHQLGLFDLYNVETFAPTVAFYDVMDSGNLASVDIPNPSTNELTQVIGVLPTAIGAWNRWFVTFQFGVSPEVVKEDFPRLRLRAIQSRADVLPPGTFKWIQLPVSDTEYYLVENRVDDLDGRFPDGSFNTALDQDDSTGVVLGPIKGDSDELSHNYDLLIDPGVLIWHIDERQALANLSVGRGLNVDFAKRSVTIEEADGLVDIGNPFSLYPQGTDREAFWDENNANFTPFTRPNSSTSLGAPSGISVMNIGPRDTTVTMDIGFSSKPTGWPMEIGELGTGGNTSTTAADADGDGVAEIAAVADPRAWLFRYDDGDGDGDADLAGSGWPSPGGGETLAGAPTYTQALGDLDGDGRLEMLVVTDSGAVHCFADSGGTWGAGDARGVLLSFTPETRPCWSAVPADLDGDGADEVYAVTLDGTLRGWDASSGTPVELFAPRVLLDAGGAADSVDTLVSTIAFGDLNGDDRLDGIVAYARNDSVHVQRFNREGRRILRIGWPLPSGVSENERSRIFIGFADVDRDAARPAQELFLASTNGWLALLDGTGTPLPGWPRVVEGPIGGPPAFGDLDDDGLLEIALLAEGRTVHAFNYNGTEMPGWPVVPDLADFPGADRIPPGPAIADVDGDGTQDVVCGFSDFTVRAFDHEGGQLDGFPIMCGAPVTTTPVILDANGDGRLDLFVQSADGNVVARILGGIASDENPAWPMLLGGPRLHGSFDDARLPDLAGTGDLVLDGPVRIFPNPARNDDGSITVRYALGSELATASGVEIAVYNLAGEEMLTRSGTTFARTENVITLPVNGFSSGVYFCRLKAWSGGRVETRLEKFAVIR